MYDNSLIIKTTHDPIYLRLLNIQFLLRDDKTRAYYCLQNSLDATCFSIGLICKKHVATIAELHIASEIFLFHDNSYKFFKNRFDVVGVDSQQHIIDYSSLQHTINIYKHRGII